MVFSPVPPSFSSPPPSKFTPFLPFSFEKKSERMKEGRKEIIKEKAKETHRYRKTQICMIDTKLGAITYK